MGKIIVSCLLLTGCGIIGDPARRGDVAPTPATFLLPEVRQKPCPIPGSLEDEHVYTLAELLDLGLENNPSTEFAWSLAKREAYTYYASKSQYFPRVDWQESVVIDDVKIIPRDTSTTDESVDTGSFGGFGGTGMSQGLSSTLSLQYLLFDFGTRSGSIASARDALIIANWQHRFTLQQVLFDVAKGYYDYLEARALAQAAEENLKNAKTALDAASAQYEAGIRTKVDLLQAKTNYYNAVLELENRRAAEKVALGALAKAVGWPANSLFRVERIAYEIHPKPLHEGIEQLMDAARAGRADLAAKETEAYRRLADLRVAKGAALPTISTNVELNRTDYWQGPIKRSHDYSAELIFDFPLFTGFFDYNQIRRARADYDAAYFDWRQLESEILVAVLASYYQYSAANENLKTADEYRAFAEESFRFVLAGYRAGIQTILDLIASQNVLADARSKYIQSRAAWLRAIVNIAFTTGMLGVDDDKPSVVPCNQEKQYAPE
jgi:outer membrane protein TolC